MRWTLEEWRAVCDEGTVDAQVLASAWAAAETTPPPVLDPPLTRYPLERALALLAEAEQAGTHPEAESEALRWLELPHPRASPATRRRMRELRDRLRERRR